MHKDFRVCLKLQPQLINKNIISNGNLNLQNSITSALKLSERPMFHRWRSLSVLTNSFSYVVFHPSIIGT